MIPPGPPAPPGVWPVAAAVMDPFCLTLIDVARMVRSPLGELSVAPASIVTGPLTTTTPSMLVLTVMSSDASGQVTDAGSQVVEQVLVTVQAVPPALHVSTLSPLQRVAPGVHAPVHRPPEQATAQVDS